ncbi:MAG: hypothetical protein AB7U61_09785 [Methylocystis sp.]
MRSFDWKAGLPFALALAASASAPQHAVAQFFFRPFAGAFRYQIPDERPPAFASRPAVASILGRTGFQLVGPLGRRGDQIVATGVSRREGEMRFIIDPYEGRILRAVRLGPLPNRRAPYAPPMAGAPGPGPTGPGRIVPGFDDGRDPEVDLAPQAPEGATLNGAPSGPVQRRAAAAKVGASSKTSRAITPPAKPASPAPDSGAKSANAGVAGPAKEAAGQPATAATDSQSAASSAGTPAPSQAPAVAEKAPDRGVTPPTAQSLAKPADSAKRSAPARRAAAARAASTRRAIVPPHVSSGTTVVAPAGSASPASGAKGSASAPDDAGKPKAGG